MFLFLMALAIPLTSCRCDPERGFPIPEAKAAEPESAMAAAIPPEIASKVRDKGDAIVAHAFGVLDSRLGKAIADVGFTNAIEFCSVHGVTLTSAIGVTNEVVLRRVTDLPRNPQNRANSNEVAIIRQFQTQLRKGVTPKPVVTASKPDTFTYFAPITLNLPMCLNCHGQPDSEIKPGILDQIRKSYPADEATGFKLGDLRGLWSVDFKRSDFVASPKPTRP